MVDDVFMREIECQDSQDCEEQLRAAVEDSRKKRFRGGIMIKEIIERWRGHRELSKQHRAEVAYCRVKPSEMDEIIASHDRLLAVAEAVGKLIELDNRRADMDYEYFLDLLHDKHMPNLKAKYDALGANK